MRKTYFEPLLNRSEKDRPFIFKLVQAHVKRLFLIILRNKIFIKICLLKFIDRIL